MVAVACANCGAPLQVPPNVEFVSCSYCGSSLRVREHGGVIFAELRGDLRDLRVAVQQGADATQQVGDELRLERLRRELHVVAGLRGSEETRLKTLAVSATPYRLLRTTLLCLLFCAGGMGFLATGQLGWTGAIGGVVVLVSLMAALPLLAWQPHSTSQRLVDLTKQEASLRSQVRDLTRRLGGTE